jgi:hypothetical protein
MKVFLQNVASSRSLAARFAAIAAKRDGERLLPFDELQQVSQSGLLAITVPTASAPFNH